MTKSAEEVVIKEGQENPLKRRVTFAENSTPQDHQPGLNQTDSPPSTALQTAVSHMPETSGSSSLSLSNNTSTDINPAELASFTQTG